MDGAQAPAPSQQSSSQSASPPRTTNTPHLSNGERQQQPQPNSSHHRPPPQYHVQHHQSPRQPQIRHQQYQHVPSTLQPPQHYLPTAQQVNTPQPQYQTSNGPQIQQPARLPAGPSQAQARSQIVADPKEDWTKSLVKMAKTAELKKHALTLQLHTTHILSQNSNLHKKERALDDFQSQRQLLEQERAQLLDRLRGVNEERERVDLNESKVKKECEEIKRQIQHLTDTDYAVAKREVDTLRQELGLEAVKSLQSQIEEKSATYRKQPRQNGAQTQTSPQEPSEGIASTSTTGFQQEAHSPSRKRGPDPPLESPTSSTPPMMADQRMDGPPPLKRPRGRPKGSKNKPKDHTRLDTVEGAMEASATSSTLAASESH